MVEYRKPFFSNIFTSKAGWLVRDLRLLDLDDISKLIGEPPEFLGKGILRSVKSP